MNPYLLLGLIGSIASIVSLIISWKIEKPRWIHMIYTFLITIITGTALFYTNSISSNNEKLTNQVIEIASIEYNASRIISTYSNTNDGGKNRGFIITSFAFLEKYKNEFPETYEIAKELVVDGLKIASSAKGKGIIEEYAEKDRLKDGADTMRSLLKGLMKADR